MKKFRLTRFGIGLVAVAAVVTPIALSVSCESSNTLLNDKNIVFKSTSETIYMGDKNKISFKIGTPTHVWNGTVTDGRGNVVSNYKSDDEYLFNNITKKEINGMHIWEGSIGKDTHVSVTNTLEVSYVVEGLSRTKILQLPSVEVYEPFILNDRKGYIKFNTIQSPFTTSDALVVDNITHDSYENESLWDKIVLLFDTCVSFENVFNKPTEITSSNNYMEFYDNRDKQYVDTKYEEYLKNMYWKTWNLDKAIQYFWDNYSDWKENK